MDLQHPNLSRPFSSLAGGSEKGCSFYGGPCVHIQGQFSESFVCTLLFGESEVRNAETSSSGA